MINKKYKNLKLRRLYRKTRLTVIADYGTEPLWLTTKNKEKKLPYNLMLLKRDLKNWSKEYESLFYNENIKYNYFIQTNKVKRFIQNGYELSKKVRKLSPIIKINEVLFFDDSIMQRKLISKKDLCVRKYDL